MTCLSHLYNLGLAVAGYTVIKRLDVAEILRIEGSTCRVAIVTIFYKSGYYQRAVKPEVMGYLLKTDMSFFVSYQQFDGSYFLTDDR